MAAATRDLTIDKGTYYQKSFIYQDDTRTPINLTGYTARMQCRKTYNSTSTILDLTTENGGLEIVALEGKITIIITDTFTTTITETKGVYDLELIDSSSKPTKFLRGTIKFPEEVTK